MQAHEIRKGDERGKATVTEATMHVRLSDGSIWILEPDCDVTAEVVRPVPTIAVTVHLTMDEIKARSDDTGRPTLDPFLVASMKLNDASRAALAAEDAT